jgi:ribosomal protein S18 acetylase RimI-like enzyme
MPSHNNTNIDAPVIRRSTSGDAEAFRESVASVARERRYLSTLDGFPLSETRAFLQRIEKENLPQLVAVSNDRIVGWCDIVPKEGPGFSHVGTLGVGVLKDWRRRGLGRKLIEECLALARASNLEKVELVVYSDNLVAIRLYESVGFTHEGRRRNARKLDGGYQDVLLMALPMAKA